MKYLKTFETHSYLDELLDKINASGYDSLTSLEKDWLNAHSTDREEETQKIEREMGKRKFTSSNRLFTFYFEEMEDYGDEQIYKGTIHVPSIDDVIEGVIEGQIEVHNGAVAPNFQKNINGLDLDIYDFCEGLEYELDKFLQDIVDELSE